MRYVLYMEYWFVSKSGIIQGMTGTSTRRCATLAMVDVLLDEAVYCPPNNKMLILHYEVSEIIAEE